MNWLITGGCGFIGTNLVHKLRNGEAHNIRVLDNLSTGSEEEMRRVTDFTKVDTGNIEGGPQGVELIVGDIRDESLAVAASAGIDAVVHLAGNTGVQPSVEDPRQDCLANVLGTLNYLEAARHNNVRRFVFASSGGTVIGDVVPPIDETMVPRPKSPYGASKSACEGYLSAYHGTFSIDTVALRFANVYGPRSHHKNSIVARFIQRALHHQPLEIYGDGNQSRDFIYVDDLTNAIQDAATTPSIGGETFQIATGYETTVNELTQALLAALIESDIPIPPIHHTNPLPGEIRRNYSDATKARTVLGWKAHTPLAQGMASTVEWFKRRGIP